MGGALIFRFALSCFETERPFSVLHPLFLILFLPFQSLHQTTQSLPRPLNLFSTSSTIPKVLSLYLLPSSIYLKSHHCPQSPTTKHLFSFAITPHSASSHSQCMNIQGTLCLLASIQPSHDTRRPRDCYLPTSGLQSLSLSSGFGLTSSESLEYSSTRSKSRLRS